MAGFIEALTTLRRQIDIVGAEIRIAERKIEKAEENSEPWRALVVRRDILLGKLHELSEGLRLLERA